MGENKQKRKPKNDQKDDQKEAFTLTLIDQGIDDQKQKQILVCIQQNAGFLF